MAITAGRRRITAGMLLVLGLGFTVWSLGLAVRAFAVRNWATVTGLVVRSGVEAVPDPADHTTTLYTPRVTYIYSIGDRTYIGERITFADGASSREAEARARADRYAVGTEATVRVDPAEPGSAMLDPRTPLMVYGPSILGLLAIATGVWGFVRPVPGGGGSGAG